MTGGGRPRGAKPSPEKLAEQARRRAARAEKQRRYRVRRDAGKIVVRVSIDAVDMAEELIAAGWLSRDDRDDPVAIGHALEAAVVRIIPRDGDA